MATSRIQIDEGSTLNLASNTITEDALTKHVGRSVLNNSSGTEVGTNANPIQVGDAGGSLTVDGTVAATQSGAWNVTDISGTVSLPTGAATAANQTTIIGHVDGIEGLLTTIDADTGVLAGAVAGTEVQVDVVAALPAGTNAIGKLAANSGVDIGDVDVTSAIITGGAVAHDSADSGNPIKVGAKAITALSGATLVASADRTDNVSDLDGAQIIRQDATLGDLVSGTASNTDGTSTQVLAAGAAGIKHYITDVTIVNTSSSTIYVELKDGTTAKWVFPVPATGGVTHSFRVPLAGTAATAWNFDPSAATTTIYCSVTAFKSKV